MKKLMEFEPVAREALELKQWIHAHMLRTRGKKYRGWLRTVSVARRATYVGERLNLSYFKDGTERVEIIDTLYAILRLIDDYVDGDAPLPAGSETSAAYVERVMYFVLHRDAPRDSLERS